MVNKKVKQKWCTFCSATDHPSWICHKYPDYATRKKRLTEMDFCYLCIKPGHIPENCPFKCPCERCGQFGHHKVLCDQAPKNIIKYKPIIDPNKRPISLANVVFDKEFLDSIKNYKPQALRQTDEQQLPEKCNKQKITFIPNRDEGKHKKQCSINTKSPDYYHWPILHCDVNNLNGGQNTSTTLETTDKFLNRFVNWVIMVPKEYLMAFSLMINLCYMYLNPAITKLIADVFKSPIMAY